MATHISKTLTRTKPGATQEINTEHGAVVHLSEKSGSSGASSRTATQGARVDSSAQSHESGARIDQAALHVGAEISYKIAVPPWLVGGINP